MHLLAAQPGEVLSGAEPIDLGQSPGDVIVLSAADTDIACLSRAYARFDGRQTLASPRLRLANWQALSHPVSVDLYCDTTARHARLIVVRLLGGRAYWPYGVDRLRALAENGGPMLALLPGDATPDPELDRLSTAPEPLLRHLFACFSAGGIDNAERALAGLFAELGTHPAPTAAMPVPDFGLYADRTAAPAQGQDRAEGSALIVFYKALVQAGQTETIDLLIRRLGDRGLSVRAAFVASLKRPDLAAEIVRMLTDRPADVLINCTGFSIGAEADDPLRAADCPVLQAPLAGVDLADWAGNLRGLPPRDIAMHVALPEIDGRIFARPIAFKSAERFDAATETTVTAHAPEAGRIAFLADLAANWARLRRTPAGERRIALILANYPNRDGRIGNGVGLDSPASAAVILDALARHGHDVGAAPRDSATLMHRLQSGTTNAARRETGAVLSIDAYRRFLDRLPADNRAALAARWGEPDKDPFFDPNRRAFVLPLHDFGGVVIGIQPARGYNIDPVQSHHDPALVPPHGYLAFYAFLREMAQVHAIIHLGKHGNLEWLPGKALALSEACWPEVALGPMPHLYPFIVNDPGEGTQAKRRAQAVILDHLTPPLTRADGHGAFLALERLIDEYFEASRMDVRRCAPLARDILDLGERLGLASVCGFSDNDGEADRLQKLDSHLCDIKDLQIRDGLHVFGRSPEGDRRIDLLRALAATTRGDRPHQAGLTEALARDLGLDPAALKDDPATPWSGPRPAVLETYGTSAWRTAGDTEERLADLARDLIAGTRLRDPAWKQVAAVLDWIAGTLAPALDASGDAEIDGLLRGLCGRAVPPGPSGAPSRGRPDVLPTGRNFYSVDNRALPTPAAFALGFESAQLLIERYVQDHGDWPRSIALSAWGTACMRTGGDDIAQALALIGTRPRWDDGSGRTVGFEILPVSLLDRPRVDVTLRVSGFFRDAFPNLIDLFDSAVRAVAALDEPAEDNPIAAATNRETAALADTGLSEKAARRRAASRVFGSKPGAYGAGLQAHIDEGIWTSRADLADSFLDWGGFAYGDGRYGDAARADFAARLSGVQSVVHNQDNREHDILDSDDYYQFEGGMAAAVEHLAGRAPTSYHMDHSRPDRLRARPLAEEVSLIVNGRAANPKWIKGVMRHGYKGAFEIAATVDYLFAFAATTEAVQDAHFDALFAAYLADETVRDFMAAHNPAALKETAARFQEAIDRDLWRPLRNDAAPVLNAILGRNEPDRSPPA